MLLDSSILLEKPVLEATFRTKLPWMEYNQIYSLTLSLMKSQLLCLKLTDFEQLMSDDICQNKGMMSKTYNTLLSPALKVSLQWQTTWHKDLLTQLPQVQWDTVWNFSLTVSKSFNIKCCYSKYHLVGI